ncbi:DUF218 domain-containing protein [Sphingomonas sp. YR710]|uniref:YdcF family protein n=1 Tax=Sphingomonas sp. YR710 TaxID=1882773 RepID=UPI000883D3A9|nr:YdcF family protein [Sphingomonas sp. YR710]SDB98675.1 DUF218 domain-containing protein [Sphingomonas sp. YR710]
MIARIVSAVVILWAAGFMVFALFLPQPAEEVILTDGIVVMTGSSGRIERGLALLRAKKAKRLLISGVDRRVRPHELASEFHAADALIDCCVDLGHESVDTRSNAEEAAGWVARNHYGSIRLVTSDWHMARARFDLARMLSANVKLTADAVPSEPDLAGLLREYNKYLLRRLAALIGI